MGGSSIDVLLVSLIAFSPFSFPLLLGRGCLGKAVYHYIKGMVSGVCDSHSRIFATVRFIGTGPAGDSARVHTNE